MDCGTNNLREINLSLLQKLVPNANSFSDVTYDQNTNNKLYYTTSSNLGVRIQLVYVLLS